MHGRGKLFIGIFTAALLLAVGCTERAAPTLPETSSAPSMSRIGQDGGHRHVKARGRKHRLSNRLSATERIGANGGTIELRGTGLRMEIPKGALPLSRSQRSIDITVTAVSGSGLAYEFEPHGLVFRKPIRIVQDLKDTDLENDDALAGLARGIYFDGALSDDEVEAVEERPTEVDVKHKTLSFSVEHFSGYLVAVGFF